MQLLEQQPKQRVFHWVRLNEGRVQIGQVRLASGVSASLSATEARELADSLCAHADALERTETECSALRPRTWRAQGVELEVRWPTRFTGRVEISLQEGKRVVLTNLPGYMAHEVGTELVKRAQRLCQKGHVGAGDVE